MKRFLVPSLALAFVTAALLGHNAPSQAGGKAKNPVVVMKTSMGTIKIELFADKSPVTVKNFLAYTDAKHYDGLTFHRVIPDFMIQGGGFKKGISAASTPKELKDLQKPTKDPIVNEAKKNKLSNLRGTLSMARTGDPDSATSQFFINVAKNDGTVKYNILSAEAARNYLATMLIAKQAALNFLQSTEDKELTASGSPSLGSLKV
jgi:cyclophilin family peptidyl-prolyl cis-trans isomerase